MFTHQMLIDACKNIGLDPEKTSSCNLLLKSRLMSTFENPFDLTLINFPEKELREVIEIGKIIKNLISQSPWPPQFNLTTKEGKSEFESHLLIKKIMPVLKESIKFWLESGLKKCETTKKFLIHNGTIYEINPEFQKNMDKMNKAMEEVMRDSRRKQAASEESARHVFLD